MKIIEQSVEIIDLIGDETIYKKLELAGRVCYKSEDKIKDESAKDFIRSIIKRGHESVLEHVNLTVKWITDRGVSHELVRHRIASYSQESTRYCNYTKSEIQFVKPVDFEIDCNLQVDLENIEHRYNTLIAEGRTPQQARFILPNCLKTEIIITMNIREWRHMLTLRCSKAAHPQMRDIAIQTLRLFVKELPVLFEDIN